MTQMFSLLPLVSACRTIENIIFVLYLIVAFALQAVSTKSQIPIKVGDIQEK